MLRFKVNTCIEFRVYHKVPATEEINTTIVIFYNCFYFHILSSGNVINNEAVQSRWFYTSNRK